MQVDLATALRHAMGERTPGDPACVSCLAMALPAGRLRAVWDAFHALPQAVRRRAIANPLAAARWVARRTRAGRLDPHGIGPAWGIVVARRDGHASFAARVGRSWWARSTIGLARVHAGRVVAAWEIV